MARNFVTILRLPTAVTLSTSGLAIVLGALSLFTLAPQFDSFVRGAFLGAGCTLLVAAGVMLAPLLWSTVTRPDEHTDWRPSGTKP